MKKITILLIWLFAGPAMAENYKFVTSVEAKVRAEPDFGATVVSVVKRGQRLPVLDERNGWYQTRVGDRSGWIVTLLLQDRLPARPAWKSATGTKTFETEKQKRNIRRRASATSSAAAARGFHDKKQALKNQTRADYQALEKVESATVEQTAVERFNREKEKQNPAVSPGGRNP